MNSKQIGIGAFGGSVAVMCAASVAWACTYQPRIFGLSAEAGQPSSAVTVSGQAAVGQGQQVEIRWNGAAGPVLGAVAAGAGGDFKATVNVPADATPDVYYIVAVAGNQGVARSAFEVTAPAPVSGVTTGDTARASQADAWNSGFSQTGTSTSRGAGIVDAAAQNGSTPGMAIGLGLLVGGGVVLGGLGVATARRRARAQA